MHQKPFFLHRFRYSANAYQFRLIWGLRLGLAFLLLLLVLFPSFQAGISPTVVKGIAILSLALLGLICFLDVRRESAPSGNTNGAASTQPEPNIQYPAAAVKTKTQVISKKFHPFRIHSIVFEVNTIVEQQKLNRKTVDLFVLPNTDGNRFASKAIARLKAAGYAIRPHSELPALDGIAETDISLIGVHDGCIHVFLGNR
jgi:hypothetical protein